jgi:hypothetical protein
MVVLLRGRGGGKSSWVGWMGMRAIQLGAIRCIFAAGAQPIRPGQVDASCASDGRSPAKLVVHRIERPRSPDRRA